MQIRKSANIFIFHESNLPKIPHYNRLYFLRSAYVSYVKYLFINIQKQ